MPVILSLVLGLVLCCGTAQGQEATWDGIPVTGPILIYHDEVAVSPTVPPLSTLDDPGSRALYCRTESGRASWNQPNGVSVTSSTAGIFYQTRTNPGVFPSLAGVVRSRDSTTSDPNHNGLWTCRMTGEAIGAVPVGLYQIGQGRIATNQVTLSSSPSFTGDPPTFTLVGRTSGGPPTTSSWTRDGAVITDGVSLSVDETTDARFGQSIYVSTLTVTGRLPGEYTYAVTNRATATMVNHSFTIEGGAASGLMAEQTLLTTVLVTWTAPSPGHSSGYRVTVPSASINETVPGTSRTFRDEIQPGDYTVQVLALSQHFPNSQAVSTGFTVRSNFAPVVTMPSPTATSVTISWTHPEFSLPVSLYTVSLIRVTGSGLPPLCSSFEDNRPAESTSGTSMAFTGLQESSVYRVTVTPTFSGPLLAPGISAERDFTTSSAAPTGAPRAVVPSVTSRSIMVTWDTIECIERNGEITGYTVEFQEQGGASIPGEVMGQSFTASRLTPHTTYTFRVAGVNSIGTGPFTELETITTEEDIPGPVSALMAQPGFTSVTFTWSAPQEPNGVITRYEVTYRVSGGSPVTTTTNLNTTFTIQSLATQTTVSDISVSAYTRIGRGEAASLPDTMTLSAPPVVTNIRVQEMSPTSVLVSWDGLDFPELTGYRVYYRQTGGRKRQAEEMMVMVSRDQTSAVITGLMRMVVYQFQVVALAEFQGMEFVGNRSEVNMNTMFALTTPPPTVGSTSAPLASEGSGALTSPSMGTTASPGAGCSSEEGIPISVAVSISVVVSSLLTILLYTTVLLVVGAVCRHSRNTKGASETERDQVPAIYEDLDTAKAGGGTLEMKVNAAYGPVSAGQPSQGVCEVIYN